jgi:hypothetical protein
MASQSIIKRMTGLCLCGCLSTLAILAAPTPFKAPGSAITVFPDVQVSTDEPEARHVESVLAVNPRDPRNLVAASIVLDSNTRIAVYASHDGGQSWSRGKEEAGGRKVFDGLDPAVAFDREGNAYLVALGDQLALWRSSDGGLTWGPRALVPGTGWDRPWIGSDSSGKAPLDGRVYVSGKLPITVFGHRAQDVIGLSVSRDRGATFSFPKLLLPAPEKSLLNVVSDLLVAPDGRLILSLQLFSPESLSHSPLAGSYSTIVSSDGGRTFTEPRPGPAARVYGHAREGKSAYGLGGARMAMDTSTGPRSGRLYLAWLDVIDGFYRVMAASSADDGASWSKPVRVSDHLTSTDESTPAIAVTGNGIVGISWYDRRADPEDGCYQLFFAASADGAETFSPNQRIASRSTCPLATVSGAGRSKAPRGAADPIDSEYRFKNGGDTQGIVGLPGGAFQLAWIQSDTSEMQLWSVRVVVDPTRLPPGAKGSSPSTVPSSQ